MKNHYEILGLAYNASQSEIKTAYRRLSIKFHPDKNDGDPYFSSMFRQINEAYEVLSDPVKRQNYDHQRTFDQQQIRKKQEDLDRRERELKKREQSAYETNVRSQAILNEAERLMDRRSDLSNDTIIEATADNSLNKVVGIKYCLWAVILTLFYLVATKDTHSIQDNNTRSKPGIATGRARHKHRHNNKQYTEPLRSSIDSLSRIDTSIGRPTPFQDSIR